MNSLKIFEVEQLAVPCLDILIYVIIVVHLVATRGCSLTQKASYVLLIPTFSLFLVVEVTVSHRSPSKSFQSSSLIGVFVLTTQMEMATGLVAGRITNIVPYFFRFRTIPVCRWI